MRALLLSASIAALVGCASLGGPQDDLVGGWSPEEWPVCKASENESERLLICARKGESPDQWTQLVALKTIRRTPDSPSAAASANEMLDRSAKACPGFVGHILSQQDQPQGDVEQSVLVETQRASCPPEADDHSLGRLLYGKYTIFRITYRAKSQELFRERRDEWLKLLSEATIMSGSSGPTVSQ